MKNVVLIGMSGVGKSTVGVLLAKKLGYSFVDTDLCLSEKFQKPVSVLLKENGYEQFLKIEGEVGESVKLERAIIATGGSMVFSEKAMKNLKENSIIVWLDTDKNELERRISKSVDERGVAMPFRMTVSELCDYRAGFYKKYSDVYVLNVNGDLQETTNHVYDSVKDLL